MLKLPNRLRGGVSCVDAIGAIHCLLNLVAEICRRDLGSVRRLGHGLLRIWARPRVGAQGWTLCSQKGPSLRAFPTNNQLQVLLSLVFFFYQEKDIRGLNFI